MYHTVLVCVLVCLSGFCEGNSCRETKLCCPGRDSSCVVQKAQQNAIVEDPTDKPCYCDHACLKLGDCCPDFKETCGVIDCTVSAWGPWSSCDAHCGAGSMMRARKVLTPPEHGGRRCPGLAQRRACRQHRACPEHTDRSLRETAMILPASLSLTRHSNETHDIRKNLRLRNPDDPASNLHREYCVQFQVVKSSKACHLETDYKVLREDNKVCVRCEAAALRRLPDWRCAGHGVVDQATRFSALAAPHCHGKWTRADETECCDNPAFIFV